MEKVRVVNLQHFDKNITPGNTYNVVKEFEDGRIHIIDDKGKEKFLFKNQYEVINEPNYVWVRGNEYEKWEKRILVADLGEQFDSRYIVVSKSCEDAYIKGSDNISFVSYSQIKPIDPKIERIEELEKELAELKQQVSNQ